MTKSGDRHLPLLHDTNPAKPHKTTSSCLLGTTMTTRKCSSPSNIMKPSRTTSLTQRIKQEAQTKIQRPEISITGGAPFTLRQQDQQRFLAAREIAEKGSVHAR